MKYPWVLENKQSFLPKASKKDDIHLPLSNFIINTHRIKWEGSIKFLGVLIDGNSIWKEHLKFTENKCVKNIGLICKAKHHLINKCLLVLYYSYVHTHVNYVPIFQNWKKFNRATAICSF